MTEQPDPAQGSPLTPTQATRLDFARHDPARTEDLAQLSPDSLVLIVELGQIGGAGGFEVAARVVDERGLGGCEGAALSGVGLLCHVGGHLLCGRFGGGAGWTGGAGGEGNDQVKPWPEQHSTLSITRTGVLFRVGLRAGARRVP